MKGYYAKFICPTCGKKFRHKLYTIKGATPEQEQTVLGNGSIFFISRTLSSM